MAVHPSAWLHKRDRGQLAVVDVLVEMIHVHDVAGTYVLVGHDLLLILESVADVAVLIALWANFSKVELIRIVDIAVPLIVVALPGDIVGEHHVGDAALRGARNGEWRIVRIR